MPVKKKQQPSTIIVTGGAGFVGSRLALRLQDEFPDDQIVVLDNFTSGSWENLRGFRGEIVPVELGSPEAVPILARFVNTKALSLRAIFHQAAITDTTIDDTTDMMRSNCESLKQLVEIAIVQGCKLVYASTSAVYGQHPKKKMKVGSHEEPLNIYGFSKLAADQFVRYALELELAPWIVGLRYFNVYGPGELKKGKTSSYLYQIYDQLQGNNGSVRQTGTNRQVNLFQGTRDSMRDWVHVDDVVEANVRALEAQPGIYNVGSGRPISFNDLVALVGQCAELNVKCRVNETPNTRAAVYQNFTCADISKTTEALGGWKPMGPKKGVKKYVQWLQDGEG